jgi:hypothetical protein
VVHARPAGVKGTDALLGSLSYDSKDALRAGYSRSHDADGVSAGDEQADRVLEEVYALVQGLLMPIVPDAVL